MQKAVEADRQDTRIFYVEDLDVFHLIDYRARPTARDWVVVRRSFASGLAIEPFHGQSFIGVARILKRFQRGRMDAWIASILCVLI